MADQKRDTIMKKLLSSPNITHHHHRPIMNRKETPNTKLSKYLQQLSGQAELSSVQLDHNYAKPANWRPNSVFAKPPKGLFVYDEKINEVKGSQDIDILGVEHVLPRPVYDEEKAKQSMTEIEKSVMLYRKDFNVKSLDASECTNWTKVQKMLYDKALRLLNIDQLSRLASEGSWNQPLIRRVAINKCARRFRILFASFSWQTKVIVWLHNLFLDTLENMMLVSYIEMFQVLKKKVPALVDRVLTNPMVSMKHQEALNLIKRKSWEIVSLTRPVQRLPNNPFFVLVPPSSAGVTNISSTKVQRWYSHLSQIGTVVPIGCSNITSSKTTPIASLENMMAATRSKLAELRADYVGRNIILIGFNGGAALACQVALCEPVTAVICMGFPMNTVDGKRGEPDDTIFNLSVPILFVVGLDEVEDMREQLNIENGLVIVGGADEHLRISKRKQIADGINQNIVDASITDEIADFVGTVLYQSPLKLNDKGKYNKNIEKKRTPMDDIIPKKNINTSHLLNMNNFSAIKRGRTRGGIRPRAQISSQLRKAGYSGVGRPPKSVKLALQHDEPKTSSKLEANLTQRHEEPKISSVDHSTNNLTGFNLLEIPIILQDDVLVKKAQNSAAFLNQ